MRGVYTAAYIAGLSKAFADRRGVADLDIGKGFDLIAGTSTGAIVACAAAAGISMTDVVGLYREHGPHIFPIRLYDSFVRLSPQLLTRPHYLAQGNTALRSALESILKDLTLGKIYKDRGIALAVPAVEMSQQRAWVFKTSHLGGHRDDNFLLVDICLASSAAPIFRSLASVPAPDSLGGQLVFADGGLWANNPILVGLIDALKMSERNRSIELFELGTCPRPEGEQIQPNDIHRGLIEWKFGGKAAQLSISAQEFAFDNMARMLGGILTDLGRSVHVLRFPNGKVPSSILKYLDLDDARPGAMDALVAQARADINFTLSACDDPNNTDGQLVRSLFMSIPTLQK